jgi:hypothetical protein
MSNWGWGGYQVTFQDHTGRWWVPTGEGLFRFAPVSRTSALGRVHPEMVLDKRHGLVNNDVFRLFEDSHGDIWISTGGDEVALWRRADGRLLHYPRKDFLATAFLEDRAGSIWMGSSSGALSRVRDGRSESIELPRSIGWIHSLFWTARDVSGPEEPEAYCGSIRRGTACLE